MSKFTYYSKITILYLGSDIMEYNYKKLEDLYEDIKGACLDTLEENKGVLKMSTKQAIAFYMHEFGGILEENEIENIVTLISLALFMIENDFYEKAYAEKIRYAVEELKSNKYDQFLLEKNDKKLIDEDIHIVEQSNLLK